MICIGPAKWCSFLKEKVGNVDNLAVVSLNPDRYFLQRVDQLRELIIEKKRVVTYSLTTRSDLEKNPVIKQLLSKTEFVQGPTQSVVEHLMSR